MRSIASLAERRPWSRILTVFSLAAALTGCQALMNALETAPKPSVRVTGASLKNLCLTSVTLLFDVEVANPYGVPLPLVNLDYSLASDGKSFLSGKAPVQGTIPAKQSKIIQAPAELSFEPLLKVIEGVKPGAIVPYQADLNLSVDAPAVGTLVLPFSHRGTFPIPAVPSVSLPRIAWQSLSLESASGTIDLSIKNTNSFPIDLTKIAFNLSLADTKVGQAGVTKPVSIKPGDENTLQIPISISPSSLGLAAFHLLTGKERDYKLEGSMSVGTPFGPLDLPLVQTGRTTLVK
jgi:LEA14-like dessication related protein